jgi:hypothetical protein
MPFLIPPLPEDGIRALGAGGFQSLLDYLSSRVRVATQAYVARFYRLSVRQRAVFLDALSHEVVSVGSNFVT